MFIKRFVPTLPRRFRRTIVLALAASLAPALSLAVEPTISTSDQCPEDVAERLKVTPTGVLWGKTLTTVCAAGVGETSAKDAIGASAIQEEGRPDEPGTVYVSVGVLNTDPNEAAMPSSYVALPKAWSTWPEDVVLRISRVPDEAEGAIDLLIGHRIGEAGPCRWYRSTRLVPLNSLWLVPRTDAVAAAPKTTHPCNVAPPPETFRPAGPADLPAWPGA